MQRIRDGRAVRGMSARLRAHEIETASSLGDETVSLATCICSERCEGNTYAADT